MCTLTAVKRLRICWPAPRAIGSSEALLLNAFCDALCVDVSQTTPNWVNQSSWVKFLFVERCKRVSAQHQVAYFYRLSVCPSVCLWRCWVVSQRLEIALWSLWGTNRKPTLNFQMGPLLTPGPTPSPNFGVETLTPKLARLMAPNKER